MTTMTSAPVTLGRYLTRGVPNVSDDQRMRGGHVDQREPAYSGPRHSPALPGHISVIRYRSSRDSALERSGFERSVPRTDRGTGGVGLLRLWLRHSAPA